MSLAVLRLNKTKQIKESARCSLITKRDTLSARSAELEQSIGEAESEEDVALIDDEINKHDTAITENEAAISKLDDEITGLDKEIAEVVERSKEAAKAAPSAVVGGDGQQNGGYVRMQRRYKCNMTPEQRETYMKRADVRDFYERVRGYIGEKRAISGTELLIPEVMLEILRDNMDGHSKLVKHVYLKPVKGTARQNVIGEIPEGVWTEMKGALQELDFSFSKFEMDGYKVGGFIPINNANLNDSYINLAAEIEYMLSEAIGYALDKAIVYGKGKSGSMPQGFVTSLVENGLAKNIIKIDGTTKTGVDLFKGILRGVGQMKANKVRKPLTFLMNQQTWNVLVMPESLSVNAAGTLVAAANNTFPVLGGNIEFLDFIPYGDIVGGYLEKYLLVEREESKFGVSEHVRFIEDQTVFRGTARYDGVPVRPSAFFAMNILNSAPATSMSFMPDKANADTGDDLEDDESGN